MKRKNLSQQWSGNAAILPGIGIFKGSAGDNQTHCHWAHQLSIGLNDTVKIISGSTTHSAAGIFVRAGTSHRLASDSVLSIYLDPTSILSQRLTADFDSNLEIVKLPAELNRLLLKTFSDLGVVRESTTAYHAALGIKLPQQVDKRLTLVLDALHQSIQQQSHLDRAAMARLAKLSNSRFSHWFRQQTGMPLRSYKKWLQLLHGVEVALNGESLTHAAHKARFSDQAHFTRTFVQAFGISPATALAHVNQ